ncbi:MAG: hypothetical protein H6738_18815 [Alphaproteobacteria bacterium]|nr:hypothetical protein [Alphaproteobacteria bacterium]MCB9698840.1 hypothetical protein [Alphaproteobacteria bacterium]
MTWVTAFLLTQAIEMPIYLFGSRGSDLPVPWRVAVAFGASALTHPIVWFVLRDLLEARLGFWAYFAIAETFAVVVEALYLRWFELRRPLLWSLLANGTSASVGLLIWAVRSGKIFG